MSLNIYFNEDVSARLDALEQANQRALALAEFYGMDPATARLCHVIYTGALHDIAVSFGLAADTVLTIPAWRLEGRQHDGET